MLLKREEEGDAEFGRVEGFAINQDGTKQRADGTERAVAGEADCERRQCRGWRNEVEVLEAHGTGTSLGDPIEVQAVAERLGRARDEGRGW